jgi:uncharacterized protein YndB with AHSA1/START domain
MTTEVIEQELVHAFAIRKEIEIAAPIAIAFEAVLDELGPEAQMPNGATLSMKLEAWPGGRWFRDLGDNAGHLWGHVQVIKPPTLLEITGPMPMSYPAVNHVQYRLKAEGDRTKLSFTHRAMGLIEEAHRDGMPEGWEHWLGQIRDLAERRAGKK